MGKVTIQDLIARGYPQNIIRGKIKIMDLVPGEAIKGKPIVLTKHVELLCDAPHCRFPISGDSIAYNRKYNEIYHSGECITYATAMRAFKTGEMVFVNIDYITRKQALKIKSKLEKKAE